MTVMITLPHEIETKLREKAQSQQRSVEEVALDILSEALGREEAFPSLEAVVAQIQATPPNSHAVHPAGGSPADALRHAPQDPAFDLAVWQREWAAVEAEMKAIAQADDISGGRHS